jgi:hypothetical protein
MMTEAEWLACTDPTPMLEFLRDRGAERKLRLFAVACCRRIQYPLADERCRNAVDVNERYADGQAGEGALLQAHADAKAVAECVENAYRREGGDVIGVNAAAAVSLGICIFETEQWRYPDEIRDPYRGEHACTAAKNAAKYSAAAFADVKKEAWGVRRRAEMAIQSAIIRCITGSIFAPAPPIGRDWFAWGGGTVPKLAQSIYAERAFDRLPVLADALEDAGCTDHAILTHCRGPGPHVRGCWAVDLLLGRG